MRFHRDRICMTLVLLSVCGTLHANTIVPGSKQTRQLDISVKSDSTVGLTITPAVGLTADTIKYGANVGMGSYKTTGTNTAVTMGLMGGVRHPTRPWCGNMRGRSNSQANVIEVCMATNSNAFVSNGVTYYPQPAGQYNLVAGPDNKGSAKVVPDTYTLQMEAIQFNP